MLRTMRFLYFIVSYNLIWTSSGLPYDMDPSPLKDPSYLSFSGNKNKLKLTYRPNQENRYIISCHTTDYKCFKLQYIALRDNVLMGNPRLGIAHYEPYVFEYGDTGTCIKMTGMEDSHLVGISMDSNSREYSITLHVPLKIHQFVKNNTSCAKPELEFKNVDLNKGLKKFKANATILVTYPFDLRKKKGDIYMLLKEEDIDLILDIPDLSNYNKESKFEEVLYETSEWAYEVVQHIDAATHIALPYTGQMRSLTARIPLNRLILLYPDEKYLDMHFDLYDEPADSKSM